jgi:hypothetical protein
MQLVDDDETLSILFRYRLRFDVAPDLNETSFDHPDFEAEVGERLDFREGLPGLYFYWEVSEILAAPEGKPDTLFCSLVYVEGR